MKNLSSKLAFIVILTLISGLYIFPWALVGLPDPFAKIGAYKLGLDLNGGVELDYTVSMEEALAAKKGVNAAGTVAQQEQEILEGIKRKLEERVNALGTAEPTIQTAKYGDEYHVIVQIPTASFVGEELSDAEKAVRNAEFIAQAKETIGRVTRLEFREEKTTITDADRAERKTLSESARADLNTLAFDVVGKKYQDTYELIGYLPQGTGLLSDIPQPWATPELINAKKGDIIGPFATSIPGEATLDASGAVQSAEGEKGYSIVKVLDITQATASGSTGSVIAYQGIFISERPSPWTPAKTVGGKVLDEKYLTLAGVDLTNGIPKVSLTFNEEGKAIFGELTKRLVGKRIGIFVGSKLVTAPNVREPILGGQATIDGQANIQEARDLSNEINSGLIPAPIYLTSERVIDAKIASNALSVIVTAGLIGLAIIIVWLTAIYRLSGLLAGVALVIYGILLVAIVKLWGILLTLASIAGIILSIGLAIDANILIFERIKEELAAGKDALTAIRIGFDKSWSAIWDSHITSFASAFVLWLVGINLIKGFGLMLGLGILLSLFTAMWVSRILLWWLGAKIGKHYTLFIGNIK